MHLSSAAPHVTFASLTHFTALAFAAPAICLHRTCSALHCTCSALHCTALGNTCWVPTAKKPPGIFSSASETDKPIDGVPADPTASAKWLAPRIGRRKPLPSNRACAIAGILSGALDGGLLLNDGQPFVRSLIGALFLGVFVYGGMRFVTATRRRIRPDDTDPATGQGDDPTNSGDAGAPKGGWANPTGAQKFARKIARITSNYGKRRPPRR